MGGVGACGLAIACAPPAVAASPADAVAVGEVVVTASRAPEALEAAPASVSLVTAAQIRDVPAQALNDVLRLVPGLNLTQMGPDVGHPTAYNEGMRGLPTTATRMLVAKDGVPLNDPFFGYIQWNRIPLANIERVEVVRGGGSPLWGDAAMGGVVNVITRAPDRDMLDVDAAGGSYGSYRTNAYGAYRLSDKLVLGLNAGFSGTDGYQTTPSSWSSFGSTTPRSPLYVPTAFHAKNLGFRSDVAPSSDLTGWFAVDYHDNDQTLSTAIGDNHQKTWTYSGQVRKTFANGGALTAAAFHGDSDFVTANPHLLTFTTQYVSNIHRTPVQDWGGSFVWSQDLTSVLRSYMVGVDVHAISGHDFADYYLPSGALAVPTIVGGGRQLFVGGFAQVRLQPLPRLEALASLRYQYFRNSDGIDTFPPAIGGVPASDKRSVDPRVNLRYDLGGGLALRAAYYTSFRAPTLDQLYRTYADTTAGIYEGDPFLKPETLRGGEVGVDFNRPGFRSQVTLYDTRIGNLITQRSLTPEESPTVLGVTCGFDEATFTFLTCRRNINAGRALARGVEVEADWELARGLTAGLGYTYADSHYLANPEDPAAVGERLEGVPMHNVSGRVAYQAPAGWRVAADLHYVSKSYGDAHPEDNLIQEAHFAMDLSAAWRLRKNLEAYVQIQNLTDSRYIANNGGGAPILGAPFEVMSGFRLTLE
jgi:outer membrane receptor protein involved in Fe transport